MTQEQACTTEAVPNAPETHREEPVTADPATGANGRSGYVVNEQRHHTVEQTVQSDHTPASPTPPADIEGRNVKVNRLMEAVAQTQLELSCQKELGKLIALVTEIREQVAYNPQSGDLLDAVCVGLTALLAPRPNAETAAQVRKSLEGRLHPMRLPVLRADSPSSNVVLGLGLLVALVTAVVVIPSTSQVISSKIGIAGIDSNRLILVVIAGGMGSIVSILWRVGNPPSLTTVNPQVLFYTGLFKPVIGIGFALFVSAVLSAGIINFTPSQGTESYFFGAVAFLAGFSEQLAPDVMQTVVGRFGTKGDEQTTSRTTDEVTRRAEKTTGHNV